MNAWGRRLVVLLCAAFASAPSAAAVRLCGETISEGPFTAATEPDARRQALEAWKAAAAKLGESHTGWRIAADKILACKPAAEGQVACIAAARPCTIEQAPNTLDTRRKRIGI